MAAFPIFVTTARQWSALTSPVRVEIIEHLHLSGPCSVAQIAAHMGRPADTLYHHLRVLQAAGLVLQSDFRKSGRKIEAVFALASPWIRPDYDVRTGRNVAPLKRLASAVLRMADRAFAEALDRGNVEFNPDAHERGRSGMPIARRKRSRPNAWARRQVGRLTPGALASALRHFRAVSSLLARGGKRRSGTLYSWTNFFLPVCERARRHRERKS